MLNINLKPLPDTSYQKNVLYEVKKDTTVTFTETHTDSKETVYLRYAMNAQDYGIFAHEYRNPSVSKRGCKTADVLACVVDDAKEIIYTTIFGVKSNISAFSDDLSKENAMLTVIKEVRDFTEQIHDEILHKNSFMLYYKDAGYVEYERLGIATRSFERDKFSAAADRIENLFENNNERISSLVELKMKNNLAPYRNETERLRNFANKVLKISGKIYDLQVFLLEHTLGTEYAASIDIPGDVSSYAVFQRE